MTPPSSVSIARRRALTIIALSALVAALGAKLAFARGNAAAIGTGVVVVNTNLGYQNGEAAGTGMVLSSSGRVLTNNHVISGATTIKVHVPGTGRTYTARVTGYSVSSDVALLQLQNASNLKTVSTSTSKLAVGAAVRALGNAGGTGSLTSARGHITGLDRSITASDDQGGSEQLTNLIETDAPVQPGDSGGPLFDSHGHVIGMTTAASAGTSFSFREDVASDAYAIPIGRALTVANAISAGKSSSTVHIGPTAFLGIETEPNDGYGVLVAGVVSNGPAVSAGLQAGDVITALNGHAVASTTALRHLIGTMKPGTKVTVAYADQYGTTSHTTVTLGTGPAQ